MPATLAPSGWQRTFAVLGTFALVVLALWWAKPFFIVLALALLLAFALQPVVWRLERQGLRRVPAVVVSVAVAFAVLTGLGWLLTAQIKSMMADWPQYREAIKQRIRDVDPWGGPGDGYLMAQVGSLGGQVIETALPAALAFMENLVTAVFVTILVVFLLLRREDLRNRLIRLLGHDRRTIITTRALDEAAWRIGRFLLAQALVNASFGLVLGVAIVFIGLPYAPLWGFLAAIARFVPYVGTWFGLILPAVFSLATAPSWTQPLVIVAVFVVLEIVTANLVEPIFFGLSAGVSPVALLVAAVFWGWLWGPIGLVLSTPMTVCLYVMGRYVPPLGFFEVLLGDEPALEASVNFYQRLLARDRDEATDVIEEEARDRPIAEICDRVLLPALTLAKRDWERGELAEDDKAFVLEATHALATEMGQFDTLVSKPVPSAETSVGDAERDARPRIPVVACPAADEFDELVLTLLGPLLERPGARVELLSAKSLSAEMAERIQHESPAFVFVATLAPGGLAQARYLCKRLRARFPDLKILVGRWGAGDGFDHARARLIAAGANLVGATLAQSLEQAVPLVQAAAHATPTPTPQAPAAEPAQIPG